MECICDTTQLLYNMNGTYSGRVKVRCLTKSMSIQLSLNVTRADLNLHYPSYLYEGTIICIYIKNKLLEAGKLYE